MGLGRALVALSVAWKLLYTPKEKKGWNVPDFCLAATKWEISKYRKHVFFQVPNFHLPIHLFFWVFGVGLCLEGR